MRPLILALAACLAPPALAEPRVVTDIAVVQSLVAEVMGGVTLPPVLLDPGANPHDFQMRPDQARALQQADLLIWVGEEMTPWLDRALPGSGAARLTLLDAPGTHLRAFDEAAHEDGDGHDQEDDQHGHDHEGIDPHAWLDPANGIVWAQAIAEALAASDPANAERYRTNAQAAIARITALDVEIADLLRPHAGTPFVVYHDAYGYFVEAYGLTLAGTLAQGDAAAPGAAQVIALQQAATDQGARCAFPERQAGAAAMQALAQDGGLRLGGALDPEGGAFDAGPDLYRDTLRGLAETIAVCLGQD